MITRPGSLRRDASSAVEMSGLRFIGAESSRFLREGSTNFTIRNNLETAARRFHGRVYPTSDIGQRLDREVGQA
jgi:hypothetical protein